MKFIYTPCMCKCLIFINVCVSVKLCKSILCHVKQYKCKTNTPIWFYATMYNNVSVKTNISIRYYVAMQNNVSEK